ncbi:MULTISPECIES: putative bacteriocin export ABC transporter [Anaerococcus]|uniref:ATP-binding cassette domain-containing protein n=2 Tax=Anaerococcus TaxID=165779 RepID=A0A3E2TJD8_9FIRM|nr:MULTISPECIES: putative bacteriocin export ABC transporter [Anaerococcus]MBP2070348.1 putative ABC transport system ATP-binding protein [Anaerococcus nagyae]MDU1864638.1 putative bacteriocin export ABC transporter [Anaerococcus sp.]MDU2354237.1 putative bacteriocin export ABC transporter [Anaerococcus sp.]MDU2566197.1 putative bacteriocin export ABC transporter [Anaerococcus sp.]MDU3211913.1 putative bacteriocin export ABC transporter [Anaerococcus sp.]
MIKIKNLSKSFDDHMVLDNINLDIKEGEMVAILGKSGSGKSTLLNIIGLIEGDYDGDYYFKDNKNVRVNSSKSSKLIREEISYIFQSFALIEDESVRDNLKLALKYVNKSKDEEENMILEALEKVNMKDHIDKIVASLSGGEQQRVALARAILKPSSLILADEPTGSLDEKNKEYVMDVLKDLNKSGKTVLVVTHDKYTASVCQRKINL